MKKLCILCAMFAIALVGASAFAQGGAQDPVLKYLIPSSEAAFTEKVKEAGVLTDDHTLVWYVGLATQGKLDSTGNLITPGASFMKRFSLRYESGAAVLIDKARFVPQFLEGAWIKATFTWKPAEGKENLTAYYEGGKLEAPNRRIVDAGDICWVFGPETAGAIGVRLDVILKHKGPDGKYVRLTQLVGQKGSL